MYEEPEESPSEPALDPTARAKDKFDEFRMHAELAAIFEATRKFEAEILPKLDPEIARDIQRTIAKLEKSRVTDTPVIAPEAMTEAARIVSLPKTNGLSTNDYHISRRPGETMIVRFLAGEEVETFYERLQSHFDAALTHFREEERQSNEWKQDPATLKYLDALDKIEIKMSDRYLREAIKQHNVFVLSTQAADELDILHLTDVIMSVSPAQIVGQASAPPDESPTEQDRAWFFKLFSLRGIVEGVERMCFFAFLQKADDSGW